jgi:hypothetical protein
MEMLLVMSPIRFVSMRSSLSPRPPFFFLGGPHTHAVICGLRDSVIRAWEIEIVSQFRYTILILFLCMEQLF